MTNHHNNRAEHVADRMLLYQELIRVQWYERDHIGNLHGYNPVHA